ncbi:MAG: type II toxin-antitoxin system Phd/YefM family antitoxin [Anaerolineaceae bacterium]
MAQTNLSMKRVINSIIPITRFNRGEANKIFEEVKKTGVKIVLKNNLPVGVIVEPKQYDEMIELLEEYSLLVEAEKRMKNVDSRGFLSEKQVMDNLGISESDLGNVDVEIE